jgi:hypothetical protein
VGTAAFPVGDAVEVALYAIGSVDRLYHPGSYAEGAAIRFGEFQIWR